ncbi:MAG: hypothetical protein IIC89_08030, partial [Chloroflexi bacterium]|nr:hypothetical protein [Chloroflexota bacterium]
MKTMLTTVVAATLVLGTGCTIENEASITILRALSVEDDCIADVGLNGQSRGLFDVSYQNADYFQAFHARNNMPPNDDENIFRVDTNIF